MILYPDLKNNAQYLHPNVSHSLISKLAFSRKIVSTNGQYHYPTLTKKKIERAKNWDDRFAMDFQNCWRCYSNWSTGGIALFWHSECEIWTLEKNNHLIHYGLIKELLIINVLLHSFRVHSVLCKNISFRSIQVISEKV